MSYTVSEVAQGNVIEVNITGQLTKEAYADFVPMTEAKIRQFGKVRLLVIMHDFHGWNAGALWEDVKFDAKHFNHVERLAIVGESKWEKGMSVFCRPFTTAKIEYFDHTDLEKARQWINQA